MSPLKGAFTTLATEALTKMPILYSCTKAPPSGDWEKLALKFRSGKWGFICGREK